MHGVSSQLFWSLKIALRWHYKLLAALLALCSSPSLHYLKLTIWCESRSSEHWPAGLFTLSRLPLIQKGSSKTTREARSGNLKHALQWLAPLQSAVIDEGTRCSQAALHVQARLDNMSLCKWRSYLPRSWKREPYKYCTWQQTWENSKQIILVDSRCLKIVEKRCDSLHGQAFSPAWTAIFNCNVAIHNQHNILIYRSLKSFNQTAFKGHAITVSNQSDLNWHEIKSLKKYTLD